jgi:hypothetical protein
MKYLVLRKEEEAWAIAEFAEFSDAANEWHRARAVKAFARCCFMRVM